MWTILVIRSSICLILWAIRIASSSKVTILCLFDTDITETCQEALSDLPSAQDIGVNVSFRALTLKMGKDLTSAVTDIQASVNSEVPDVIFTMGSIYTANAASMFAEFQAIPQVSLTMDSMTYPLYSNSVVRFGPSELDMAEAFFHLIDTQNTSDISVIYQREHAYDEFAFHMRHLALKRPQLKRFKIFGSSKKGCQDQRFLRKMIELRDNGSQLIVLHAGSETTKHILRCAVKYELFQPGHVWISTKGDFRNCSDVTCLPAGFLALEYLPSTGFKTEIRDGLSAIVSTWRLLYLKNETIDCNGSGDDLGEAHRFVRSMETNWKKPKVTYNLKNLVREGNRSSWRVVGKVQRNLISVNTIIWPGGFIYGPIAVRKKFLRVVTVPAPPFVHFRDPDNDEHKCYTDTPCLELKKTDRVMDYLDAFVKGGSPEDQQFTFLCCSGLSVDLLNRISQDLDFEFILYFFPANVNRIGKLVNDTWDGAIGQVYYGTADIMIGALSITAVRSAWIDFTVPFYQSGFTMLSVAQDQQPSIDAFLKPFSTAVWLCILLAATLTAFISSYLEWRSPYGLNPWGRKRNRNYTLGSSLVAVYSVAFGHTFATKSPKSWPSRFILNVWALCSIFMIASYTANLAAFMAGKENVEFYKSPADPRLASKKVAVIGETSVASYIENMYPGLASTLNKTSLKTSIGMITEMKKKHFDIFIHDLPILEYARARLDGDCTLRVVGGTFADDGYGIGLPKHSPWKASMSDLILSYGTSGFLERLENTHFSELVCTSNGIKQRDIQYGLQHTAGLFIMLMVAIGVSVILLLLEHFFYRHCLPSLRAKDDNSVFKNTHMMFFSQRVHRSTTCEEIVPPSHGAKEILTQVKNKQFIDLFLKEQRKVVVTQGKTFPSSPTTRQLSSLATSLKPTQVKTSDREFTPSVLDDSYSSDGISSNLGQSGSTFVVDDGESVVGDNELHPLDFEVVSTCSSAVSRHASPGIPVSDWPSNWEEEWLSKDPDDDIVPESDDTVVHVGHNNLGFVMNNERQQNSSVMKRNISLKETERVRNPKTNRGNFVKSYSWRPSKYLASLSEDHRRTRHSGKPQTASMGNVYKKPWDMKDNRNKSRIRRNTLEYLCRAFSVDLIDSFTLDSLSKSDLLVLWKASEINLRRQLSEMTLQKESLLMLVDKETKGTEASGTPNIHSSSEDTG